LSNHLRKNGQAGTLLRPVIAALDEFQAERLASPLGDDQKQMTRLGVGHLKKAIEEAGMPIEEFIAKDGLAAYILRLEKHVSPGYLNHLKDIMRQAFRHLCQKKLLALDYGRGPVPSEESKDPHSFESYERGFPEAWLTIYPKTIMPPKIAGAITANAKIPDGVKRDYRLIIANRKELKTDATRVVFWFLIRQMALDMGISSLRELGNEAGASRLMEYFRAKGYRKDASTVRKIRALFNTMEELGLCANPFGIKRRMGEVLQLVIDLDRLPEVSPNQKYFRINGKRHIKDQGRMIECWLHPEEIKKIAAYGNPALNRWEGLSAKELEKLYEEAQGNAIARIALFLPPRPMEVWAMNYGEWKEIEDDETGEFMIILNNAREHRRKKRPDRVAPTVYIRDNEKLWRLRRAAFGAKGDIDMRESFNCGLRRPGIAMWVNPKTGKRLSPKCIREALRAALLRMGIKPERVLHATIYWQRKGVQTISRNHAKGQGDKHIAAQAGHSEDILRRHYDSPEFLATAEHLREHLWAPLGVVETPAGSAGPSGQGKAASSSAAHYVGSDELARLGAELFKVFRETGAAAEGGLQTGELVRLTNMAALRAELLCTFDEASTRLGVDIRTLERWADTHRVEKLSIDARRYLLKARLNELAQCLSPEEAGRFLNLSGRQVRNLINDGKFPDAQALGKKWLIPMAALRAYQASHGDGAKA
jgi:hypothetical protein